MKRYAKCYIEIILLSAVLNLMIEMIGRKSLWKAGLYLFTDPQVFLLNTGIILVLFTLVFLTKHKIFFCISLALLWLAVGITNGVLLNFRTTPFTAADLRLIKYAFNMLDAYMNGFQILGIGVILTITVVGLCILWKKAPIHKAAVDWRIGCGIVAITVFGVLSLTHHSMVTGLVAVRFGNIGQAYEDYGLAYCFTNSLFNTGISKPSEYSMEALAAIGQKELTSKNIFGIAENKAPNIIMVQLESFFDPTLWVKNPVQTDPIPYFRDLTHNYPSGYLSVPSVGAGTANTEFEVITGMSLDFFGPGEYPYKTILNKTSCESVAFDLKNLEYTAHAIHNNEGTFYDRNRVFPQLGFDTFIPIEFMYGIERNRNGWCKDQVLVNEIEKTLDSSLGSDFIFTISVQGHGAYPSFEYYCEQIQEMDGFIKNLIRTLDARDEPAVLVLYGDHLPGFEFEPSEMENNSLFQTQYVIWNNLHLPVKEENLEAYQLSAYVLDLLGIHEGTMIRFHQNHLNNQHRNEQKYQEDMKILEYDILYGDHEIYGGKSPYLTTDMKMGILPISIDKIVHNSGNILVFGENFNEYSKIYRNEKILDTMYVSPILLISTNVAEKKMNQAEITVRQVGRDKIPLGDPIKMDGQCLMDEKGLWSQESK